MLSDSGVHNFNRIDYSLIHNTVPGTNPYLPYQLFLQGKQAWVYPCPGSLAWSGSTLGCKGRCRTARVWSKDDYPKERPSGPRSHCKAEQSQLGSLVNSKRSNPLNTCKWAAAKAQIYNPTHHSCSLRDFGNCWSRVRPRAHVLTIKQKFFKMKLLPPIR